MTFWYEILKAYRYRSIQYTHLNFEIKARIFEFGYFQGMRKNLIFTRRKHSKYIHGTSYTAR